MEQISAWLPIHPLSDKVKWQLTMSNSTADTVLILTPVKDAERFLDTYFSALEKLSYPPDRLSLGMLESDSKDGTFAKLSERLPDLNKKFVSAKLWNYDFGYTMPAGMPRAAPLIQGLRRTILAKSRNRLLFSALGDQDWVLWLDVDVCEYPPDVIERLIATECDIVHPHCVEEYGGRTFDRNAWRDHGETHMDQLRGGNDLVRLDAVGGTMLLVRADCHRDGLIFPSFAFGAEHPAVRKNNGWHPQSERGEIETEGLGIMAQAMGFQCWGMPNLEILHHNF